jgi:uncharacterized Zn-finger protein
MYHFGHKSLKEKDRWIDKPIFCNRNMSYGHPHIQWVETVDDVRDAECPFAGPVHTPTTSMATSHEGHLRTPFSIGKTLTTLSDS